MWHAGNIFATCTGAYRGRVEEGRNVRAIVNVLRVIHALQCTLMRDDRRKGYAPARNITPRSASVANYPSNASRALTTNRDMRNTVHTHTLAHIGWCLMAHASKNTVARPFRQEPFNRSSLYISPQWWLQRNYALTDFVAADVPLLAIRFPLFGRLLIGCHFW